MSPPFLLISVFEGIVIGLKIPLLSPKRADKVKSRSQEVSNVACSKNFRGRFRNRYR